MADTDKKYLDKTGLSKLWEIIKTTIKKHQHTVATTGSVADKTIQGNVTCNETYNNGILTVTFSFENTHSHTFDGRNVVTSEAQFISA